MKMVTQEKNNWDKGSSREVFTSVSQKTTYKTLAENTFVTAVPSNQQANAEKMLSDFRGATKTLLQQEISFQQRQRLSTQDKLNISNAYLREPTHVQAQEIFNTMSEKLIEAHPNNGQNVVKEAEKNINGALNNAITSKTVAKNAVISPLKPTK